MEPTNNQNIQPAKQPEGQPASGEQAPVTPEVNPVSPAPQPASAAPAPRPSDPAPVTTPPPSNSPVIAQDQVKPDIGPSPAEAADVDVIEKEWVDQAEKIVEQTKGDPYLEEEAVEALQMDYLKKRYGHDVKKPEGSQ